MPTVLRVKGYRFFFFSNEMNEPRHVHIESGEKYGKFWLEPVVLARNLGFRHFELTEIRTLITEHKSYIEEKWDEYFSG
jgi:hypothetical protein